MDTSRLARRLAGSTFSQHAGSLLKLVRPAIDIEVTRLAIEPGASRFGGSPDLPKGTPWPESPNGPYRFVAQIDCSALPDVGAPLPTAGLLSLFVGVDSDDGEFFWQSPGYVKALFTPAGTRLTAIAPPKSVSWGKARAVRFRATIDVPHDEHQVATWPLGTDYDVLDEYSKIRSSLHTSPHYLLGYPSHNSLAYDPTPKRGWQSLVTLGSNGPLGWEWHDGDKLMVFIQKARLAKHDFGALASDAG